MLITPVGVISMLDYTPLPNSSPLAQILQKIDKIDIDRWRKVVYDTRRGPKCMCAKFGPNRLRNGIFYSEHTAEPGKPASNL